MHASSPEIDSDSRNRVRLGVEFYLPILSINLITSHHGLFLIALVSY